MSESLRGLCYYVYNKGLVEFTAKDYMVFALKAIGYSISGLIRRLLRIK